MNDCFRCGNGSGDLCDGCLRDDTALDERIRAEQARMVVENVAKSERWAEEVRLSQRAACRDLAAVHRRWELIACVHWMDEQLSRWKHRVGAVGTDWRRLERRDAVRSSFDAAVSNPDPMRFSVRQRERMLPR